jgi:DNA mismatch repair protein MutL
MAVMKENKIHILDDLLVDQIAAGEVVERPASVVKELIENALDAGATGISVSMLNGGMSLIEVKDNGCGMSREDLELSIQRFGTSKVRDSEDLVTIATYGFRGEALPSIASVSALTVITKEAGAAQAYQLCLQGGGAPEIVERSAPEGTAVRIENLFYNVPARKKFLKSEKSESNAVRSVVSDFALAKPEIAFLLYENGKEIFQTSAGDSLKSRVVSGTLVQGDCFQVSLVRTYRDADKEVSVEGYLSQPLFCPRVSSKIRCIVNGRVVKSPFLFRAVRDGFGSYLKPGYYPSGVIAVTVPPEDVDVNVHPQKTEVRFRYEALLFSVVKEAVTQGLRGASDALVEEKVYTLGSPRSRAPEVQSEISFVGNGPHIRHDIASGWLSASENGTVLSHAAVNEPEPAPHSLRYIGQIFKLYLLFEGRENFAIVDMHAAHERVTFFRLKKSFMNKSVPVQELLIPLCIPVGSLGDVDALEEKVAALQAFGITAEVRNDEVLIRAIPDMLHPEDLTKIGHELVSSVPSGGIQTRMEEATDQYLARLACHASLRRGAMLESAGAYALMDQLHEAENSGWCPHGRPVIWWISEDELEKKFGRVV